MMQVKKRQEHDQKKNKRKRPRHEAVEKLKQQLRNQWLQKQKIKMKKIIIKTKKKQKLTEDHRLEQEEPRKENTTNHSVKRVRFSDFVTYHYI
jgi:hypothetical protein